MTIIHEITVKYWLYLEPEPLVTELFIHNKKTNISNVFITKSYSDVSKDIKLRLNHN